MKQFLYIATLAGMLAACSPVTPIPTPATALPTTMEPKTIGYDAYNATATAHLKEMLGKTGKVTVSLNGKEHALTAAETAELQALLNGVQSATPSCAPADCFYLNLYAADGQWLMSQPVQKTPEGIVLLYLKLQGNNAGVPLQNWWQGIANRLSL